MDKFEIKNDDTVSNIVYRENIKGREIVVILIKREVSPKLKEMLKEVPIEWGLNTTTISMNLPNEWHCGYIEVTPDEFADMECDGTSHISCHGGITYIGYIEDKPYIGFDCYNMGSTTDKYSVDYCINECKSIIEQLKEL